MFNGIVHTLSDVRYVSDLQNNLISLGTIDGNSCRRTLEKGTLRVALGVSSCDEG